MSTELNECTSTPVPHRDDYVDADVEEGARDLLELTDESGRGRKKRQGEY